MSTQVMTPRAASSRQSTTTSTNRVDLSAIRTEGSGLPNRYILHAVEGFGKTSFGAKFPKPIFIQSRGETGLQTLIDANRLPATAHFPESNEWQNVLNIIETLTTESHDYKTLVIDTLNGVERLCHEFVCVKDFGGEWGDKGFASYQKGPEVALAEWRVLLSSLGRLREARNMTIVCLLHTKVQKFSNPEGADYDRYQPDVDKRTWSLTAKWADEILFGNFESAVTAIKENKKTGEQKGKGMGGQLRMIYTQRHAAYDAKDRLGLPKEIDAGDSPDDMWANFKNAVVVARGQKAEVVSGQ